MSYDFEYYDGRYLKYPTKPSKPTLGRNPTAVDARAFADAFEEFEREYAGYIEDKNFYNSQASARMNEFQDKLMKDYGISQKGFDVIWNKAYSDGHSGGLEEVYSRFDSLYDFLTEWERTKPE